MSVKKIAIVGGGISGLATAFYLEDFFEKSPTDVEITLFEASTRLGGKIHSQRFENGVIMEAGAESFLSRKQAGLEFCEQLGLQQELVGTRPETRKTFVWHQNQLHPLPEGLSGFVPSNLKALKATTLLSGFGKLRVALDRYLPALKSDADESLARFISRRIGKQAYQRLVQPLLCGIYCGDGDDLSLAATYPELRQLERDHGSLIRGLQARSSNTPSELPPFVTLPNGMSQLVEKAAGSLEQTEVRFESKVQKISKSENRFAVELENDEFTFDSVVLTSPAHQTASIVGSQNQQLQDLLLTIPHVSTAAVNLLYDANALDHQLDGYGFVIPSNEQNGLTAVTWTSSKHYNRAPDHLKLIRAYVGRAHAEIDCSLSDQQIFELVQPELQRTMGIEVEPKEIHVSRWHLGSPQYTMGHRDRLEKIERLIKQMPGLFLTGASYRGVGIPDCIRNARETADRVVSFICEK